LVPGTYYVRVYGYFPASPVLNYSLHLTVYSSAVSDTTDPVITAITPTLSEPYGPCGANIDVISHDAYGIEEVKLFYRVNYGSWNNYSMYKGSYDHYLTAIGHFAEGDFVQYYFTSEDSSSNHNEQTSDNGGSYYSFTVPHNDFSGPLIAHVGIYPQNPNDTSIVRVLSDITDSNDISYAIVTYRVNSGSWINESMFTLTDDVFEAIIDVFSYGSFVEYLIIAVDNSSNHNIAINDNSGLYYYFNVGASDVTPPVISDIHVSLQPPIEGLAFSIRCNATDESGISSVWIIYRVNYDSWIIRRMDLLEGDTYSHAFDPLLANDFVEYYFYAYDDYQQQNEAYDDNNGNYYNFLVQGSTTNVTLYFLLPALAGLSIAVMIRKKR
ncbi:MAG: hypothetical protein ACTSO7_16135, partial [Candidatus Heimdallarchaeota archaeon]